MSCVAQRLIFCQNTKSVVLLEDLMQPVQVCKCMEVLFQGAARNKYLWRLSCFILFKALNIECIMQVVSSVSLFHTSWCK